jgi:hypothetical protein
MGCFHSKHDLRGIKVPLSAFSKNYGKAAESSYEMMVIVSGNCLNGVNKSNEIAIGVHGM